MLEQIHIADSDALIALFNTIDAHHAKVKEIIQKVTEKQGKIVFPATAITEALTTMKFKFAPDIVKEAAEKIASSTLITAPTDAEIIQIATGIFDPKGSEWNTMFDATVAATAKKYGTQTIFSFDGWYRSLGFTLLADIL